MSGTTCGCVAVVEYGPRGLPLEAQVPTTTIQHCQLHAAAPEMLEALKSCLGGDQGWATFASDVVAKAEPAVPSMRVNKIYQSAHEKPGRVEFGG